VDLMAALEASLARAKEPGRTSEPEADAEASGRRKKRASA
jgi:hypothetical protein